MRNRKSFLLVSSAVIAFGTVYALAFLGSFLAAEGSLLDEIKSLGNVLLGLTMWVPLAGYILITKDRTPDRRFEVVAFSLLLGVSLYAPSYLFTGSYEFGVANPAIVRFLIANAVSMVVLLTVVHFTSYSKKTNR